MDGFYGKPFWNGWFGGTTIFGNIQLYILESSLFQKVDLKIVVVTFMVVGPNSCLALPLGDDIRLNQQPFLLLTNGASLRPQRWPAVFDLDAMGGPWIGWKDGTWMTRNLVIPPQKRCLLKKPHKESQQVASSIFMLYSSIVPYVLCSKWNLTPPKKIHLDFMKKNDLPQLLLFLGRFENHRLQVTQGILIGRKWYRKSVGGTSVEASFRGGSFRGGWFSLIRWKFRVEFLPQKNQDC